MKEIMQKNKELIVAIAVVLILIVTGSFAWLTLTKTGEKVNVIRSGSLSLILNETSESGILLQKAIPMSYQQGIKTTEYTFTLKNNGTATSDYEVSLIDLATYTDENGDEITIADEDRLADTKIRYILLKNGEEAQASNSMLLSEATDRIIDSGTISSNEEITYSLRVWIDSKAENSQSTDEEETVMGKIFNAKLTVSATQHQETTTETTKTAYYAFGLPTTSSSTNFMDVITSSGSNTFMKLEDEQLSVCIYGNSILECFKNNNLEEENAHLIEVFGEDNCTPDSSSLACDDGNFYCYSSGDGTINCTDNTSETGCSLFSDNYVYCS